MVELIINDAQIELSPNTSIKYSKQISDIFDLAKVSSSFTNSFDFEKSPKNTQAMEQLGISGDGSNVPYLKNTAEIKVDGFHLVENGWANISETAENYKVSVIDGMVDFFKAIENKTMGNDLDLSNFEHLKTFENVISSWGNDYYKYLIADYGGKNIYDDGINIDYLTPSFSVRKLWELVFLTFGFNCNYENLGYIDNLFLTYPKDVTSEDVIQTQVANLRKNAFVSNKAATSGGGLGLASSDRVWDNSILVEGWVNRTGYYIGRNSFYTFTLKNQNYATYARDRRSPRSVDPSVYILRNGVPIGSIVSNFEDGEGLLKEGTFSASCDVGDVITVGLLAPHTIQRRPLDGTGAFKPFNFLRWTNELIELNITRSDLGATVLKNELKDFSIKDFIKEVIWRTGLTPVYNHENNEVIFKTLDSRVDFANYTDLSDTFIERVGETYINGYAQKNTFALMKNNDFDKTGDGYLYVPNVNIPDSSTLVQSRIYAPDKNIFTDFFGVKTNQYKVWDTEVKKNNLDEIEVTYKSLSGRFYFIRSTQSELNFKITSEKLIESQLVNNALFAVNNDTLFEEAISKNYQEYQKIFNNFRAHKIKQILNINNFISLDLTNPVFFKQENAYYICNKISFEEGKETVNEYIKINKI